MSKKYGAFVRGINVDVPLIENTFWPNCSVDVFTLNDLAHNLRMRGRGPKNHLDEVRRELPDHVKAILDTVAPVLDDRYWLVNDTLRKSPRFKEKLSVVEDLPPQNEDDFREDRA